MALSHEVLDVEIAGHKANIIQWKRSIDISRIVIRALETYKKTLPPEKDLKTKK